MQLTRVQREALRKLGAFSALEDAALDALAYCLRGRGYEAGESIFLEGDPGHSMFFVIRGSVTAHVRRAGDASTEINRMHAGEFFGEMSLLDASARSASVVAATDTELYELDQDGMDLLRERLPTVASALVAEIIRSLARRLRRLDAWIGRELTALGETMDAAPSRRVMSEPDPAGSA